MSWAVWLAVPVALTVVAALVTWLRSRPARIPGTDQAMREHSEYLDALARTAQSPRATQPRGPHAPPTD